MLCSVMTCPVDVVGSPQLLKKKIIVSEFEDVEEDALLKM